MKLGALIGGLVGLGLAAWLLASYGIGAILDLVRHAGWDGVFAVVLFHLVEVLFSALGWHAVTAPADKRPSLGAYLVLRGIREAINNLLPVAQVGGEFVTARLLQRRGLRLADAIAGTLADLTVQVVTQILFTLLGLVLLLRSVGDSDLAGYVASGLLVGALAVAGLLGAQWLGLAAVIERGVTQLGRTAGWDGAAEAEGLHAALIACYRAPGRVARSALWHIVSWLLGGVEVCLALHFLGQDVGLGAGLIIESLGQALKAAGFAVPASLGVQEGGFVLICQALGLTPEMAIALSLMKRLRDVILGVPGLALWQREARAGGRVRSTDGRNAASPQMARGRRE